MYVCMSVMGLQLKYRGLRIVYVASWYVPLMMLRSKLSRTQRVNCSTKG